jgi:tetratricopeptide (TPR) repeat protein
MRTIFILAVYNLLMIAGAMAQTKPKSKPAEKAPTQKEMEAMMKEMQQAMDDMDPETKRLMDSMGIKMPGLKTIPKVGDQALAKAYDEETRLVPPKDAARIASIAPTPAETALPAYIAKANAAVATKLSPAQVAEAEKFYQSAKATAPTATGNAAIGLWMAAIPMQAAWLMGKACADNPADIDNLNNYAAMLTMLSAEPVAIPMLNLLNKQFPKNTTILNNLGQAWFGLGEIDKANKYFDTVIRIYAYHPQANYTKSLIEESRGNIPAAVEAINRSAQKSYNQRKEDRLRKLGQKPSGKNIDFPFPMPQDPLGLEKFGWPAYPTEVYQSIDLQKEWDKFKEMCRKEVDIMKPKYERLLQQAQEEQAARIKKLTSAMQQGASTVDQNLIMPPFALAAARKLDYLVNDKDGGKAYRMERLGKTGAALQMETAELQKQMNKEHEAVREKYDPLIGEGRPNPLLEYCNAMNEVTNKYLAAINPKWEQYNKEYLAELRRNTNDQIYYAQYTMHPTDFEAAKLNAKMGWLGAIADQSFEEGQLGPFCPSSRPGEEKKDNKTKLAEFDDVACQYISHTDLYVMEFTTSCSRLEGKLKLGNIEYTRKVDMDRDVLLAASLEVKLGMKKGWEKGPVAAEAGAEVTGKIEWDDKQITNWVVSADAGVSVGSNLGYGDKSIEIAGANAQIGMNAGPSVTGRGALKGISIK